MNSSKRKNMWSGRGCPEANAVNQNGSDVSQVAKSAKGFSRKKEPHMQSTGPETALPVQGTASS